MNRTNVLTDRRESFYLERVNSFGPRYENFDRPTVESVLSLAFAYDVLHQCTSKYMAEFGLSKSTFNVLMVLRHGPAEGMQLHDLGEMLLVSRANITGLITHLEEKGYVTRTTDEQDRRARYARITDRGEALLERFVPQHYQKINILLRGLSTAEKAELTGLLTKLRNSIKLNAATCERSVAAEL